MNILCIGNSFSDDATRYLYDICRKQGIHNVHISNLFIGGCSLETHYRNMLSEKYAYTLTINGIPSGYPMSIKDALLNRHWDIITVQQVSCSAPFYHTFQPYLNELIAYIRKYQPKAKLAIHETWAYEKDSDRLLSLNFHTPAEMHEQVHASYQQAFKETNADFYIPSGTMFMRLLENGIEKVHRDTFHATLGLGRYALGLLWCHVLFNQDITENRFDDFDVPVTQEEQDIAKRCVMEF